MNHGYINKPIYSLIPADIKGFDSLAELAHNGERRMGANPHANGGKLLRDLRMPNFLSTR